MTEVISDVYDIGQPTPVSLEKLSAIALSLELWRREVDEYRKSHTLESFDPYRPRIPLKAALPELPSVIYNIIHKYAKRFRDSVSDWIFDHCSKIFKLDYNHRMNFFENFDDFVCDYDGSIHYVKTAERMMRCDRFDDATKFNIACIYFLENDIRGIWPFVSNSMNIDYIDFNKYPHKYYWICRLTNKLHKITLTEGNVTIDEEMIDRDICRNVPSLEYFWNGVSREKQMRIAFWYCKIDTKIFIAIILPKLDGQQLNEFVNQCGCSLMCVLLQSDESIDEELVLGTWLYIVKIMSESQFKLLVVNMSINEYCRMLDDNKDNAEDHVRDYADGVECRNKHTYLCCAIWNNSPPNLKSSVIRDLLPGTELFKYKYEDEDESEDEDEEETIDFEPTHINVELLLLILRCASIEERSSFWRNCWHLLIAAARGEDLQRIMKLCFETREHEMAECKEIMARSENVRRLCVRLLREGEYFQHLNELVSFIRPEMHNARNFKQQILRECLILRPRYRLEAWIVRSAEKFNDFITSAYNDGDLSAVKNQLIPKIRDGLWGLIRNQRVPVEQLIKFIDSFVPTEETVVEIKMIIIESVKRCVTATARRPEQDIIGKSYFTSILRWCLGSDEEVDKFKLTCAS